MVFLTPRLVRLVGSFLLLNSVATSAQEYTDDGELISSNSDTLSWSQWLGSRYFCKCYEGESCWPSVHQWSRLNATVGGALSRVVPDAAVCHNTFEGKSTYNAEKCVEVTAKWTDQNWVSDTQVGAHWVHWTNMTCMPTDDPSSPCTQGFTAEYVIMATKREHVQAGINFARDNNIRLIIRNTGHDFMGRSTGYGALAINTHNLKSITFHDRWTGAGDYTGGAVTVGAGVQGGELLTAASSRSPPLAVVTGECATVGFAGGFIQGGGHGPLATLHGMAADQALQFEVITAAGRYVTANSRSNSDLFWALKGGGPSTFATVLSVTVKTFPETIASGAHLNINFTHTFDQEVIWKGFAAFHNLANHWVDNNMFAYYEIFPLLFRVRPFVAPNMNATQLEAVLAPMVAQLEADNVPYELVVKQFPTFHSLYVDMFEGENGGNQVLVGGRIFTRSDIANHGNEIVEAKKNLAQYGLIGHIVGPGVNLPVSDTPIHPKWRQASSMTITMYPTTPNMTWEQRNAAEKFLTDNVDGPLRAASPNGAAYVNEGNLAEPNWQNAFWGDNYARLKGIKAKWDPLGVFYARTTPGTEEWEVMDYGRRLCRQF